MSECAFPLFIHVSSVSFVYPSRILHISFVYPNAVYFFFYFWSVVLRFLLCLVSRLSLTSPSREHTWEEIYFIYLWRKIFSQPRPFLHRHCSLSCLLIFLPSFFSVLFFFSFMQVIFPLWYVASSSCFCFVLQRVSSATNDSLPLSRESSFFSFLQLNSFFSLIYFPLSSQFSSSFSLFSSLPCLRSSSCLLLVIPFHSLLCLSFHSSILFSILQFVFRL